MRKNRRMRLVKHVGNKDDNVSASGNGREVAKVRLMITMKLKIMKKKNSSTLSELRFSELACLSHASFLNSLSLATALVFPLT